MRILLTNDDGIFAQGLAAIYKRLIELGQVTVVAPTECRSGTSHSITFNQPLVCNKVNIDGLFTGYGVHGSPADCVKLAAMQLHDGPIDLVVSGINHGANVGINVYYSGTVAAAIEGAFMRIPAVAISLAAEEVMDFQTAADYGLNILKTLLPIRPGEVININIPDLSAGRPKGVVVVPQSTNGYDECYLQDQQFSGNSYLLSCGRHRPDERATDTMMLIQGYITVTPLKPDMTDHKALDGLRERLESLSVIS